jgi:predicted DNA-binding protein
MARSGAESKAEIMTFRISPALKAALSEIAVEEAKPVGELLRELIERRVKEKERLEFEAEARRQSLLIAEAAKDPNSDEAQVMRELDANFEEFARELAEQEEAAEKRRAGKWK